MAYDMIHCDALHVADHLVEGAVHCVVTSPPYWSLRDYGVPPTEWPDGTKCCLGLEETPDKFIEHLCDVFDSVKKVLRDDGTLWINLGDTFAGGGGITGVPENWESLSMSNREKYPENAPSRDNKRFGLKKKDLILTPFRLATEPQKRGLYLRQVIIWEKPNPARESVTDRPTTSHEYIFLMSKKPQYYYDMEAIRTESGANCGSVWKITVTNYKGAHFATFPPDLVERCIRAGTSEKGACVECGAPYVRLIEKGEADDEWKKKSGADSDGEYRGQATKDYEFGGAENPSDVKRRILAGMVTRTTIGWERSCACKDRDPEGSATPINHVPCTVLDPFSGAGTTALVADRLGRDAIGTDLKEEYIQMADNRVYDDAPLFHQPHLKE